MIFELEAKIRALLSPIQGKHSRIEREHTTEWQLAQLEDSLQKLFTEVFQTVSFDDMKALYRTISRSTHTDREISNVLFQKKLVLSKGTLEDLEHLAKENNRNQRKNNGFFFKLIANIYKPIYDKRVISKAPIDSVNFFEKFENTLINANLYNVNEARTFDMMKDIDIIYYAVGPNQAYAGSAANWINYLLEKQIYELMVLYSDKLTIIQKIHDDFSQKKQEIKIDFASVMKCVHNVIPNNDNVSIEPTMPALHPSNEAIIKFNLLLALSAGKKIQRASSYSYDRNMKVNSIVSNMNVPFIPIPGSKQHCFSYELHLALWHALYADPSSSKIICRDTIDVYADQEYTNRQFQILQKLFSLPHDSDELSKFGLKCTDIRSLNEWASRESISYPFVTEAIQWLYRHGRNSSLPNPYTIHLLFEKDVFDTNGSADVEDYPIAFMHQNFKQIKNTIARHPQTIALNRFSNNVKNYIAALPFYILGAAMFLVGLMGILADFLPPNFMNSIFSEMILIPSLYMVMAGALLIGTFMLHGALDLALDTLSRLSQPIEVPLYHPNLPRVVNELHAQIWLPFKRIVTSPVHDFAPGELRKILTALYPVRVLVGAALSLAGLLSLASVEIINSGVTKVVVGYFSLANLWFDYPDYLQLLKNMFIWNKNKDSDNVCSGSPQSDPLRSNEPSVHPQAKALTIMYSNSQEKNRSTDSKERNTNDSPVEVSNLRVS